MIYSQSGNDRFFGKVGNIKNFPRNKSIWAFAYKEDERACNLMCKPVRGKIKEDEYFYEYKKDGKTLKKNGVTIYARYFTDTYEEAVKGFNMLVSRRIKLLKDEIVKLESMLIAENKGNVKSDISI